MNKEYKLFIKNFINQPNIIGSIAPSSRFLCSSMLKGIDFNKAKCIVEYGAGTGRFTKEIIKRKKKETLFLSFELNKSLYENLKAYEDKENNVWIINDSAEFVKGYLKRLGGERIDYVVSGLPFTVLPKDMAYRIMHHTFDILENNGEFRTFQYSTYYLKSFKDLFPYVNLRFQMINIPPAFIYYCKKTI
ncbi:class I SAM-dependent methyltransferase [Serpentinicella alkaliphila]|uniref:Phospholipid N-methyltransferase n=1 Tax=Serpentinicella alkaliphila TaxID=1734049 RepID=A0A4R2T860_9FIRM|nr:rRNA adenine N-6-methyltransferase family protein [Serpentinicella alkaliphila]QUH25604.1 SAM-dependent methyltransferase [Serpentinicella alkaliphila]TCP98385.1 phospholipid N-methyltransferase [Serpentinicella alkaliphila]